MTAKVTIEKGTRITLEELTIKRPATGIPPKYVHKIIGKITKKQILADESIKWKDIQ
ncbi:MAG: hypothetical protein KGL95_16335 [Patescibacteria group bacterium]|nr:hypothetical protein [Patescibacteria group bacterium]